MATHMRTAGLLPVLLLAAGGNALADEYHYNNILIGERASGFGGAYTAISDDPSGLFYNPSGIVYASGANLSASANAYHITKLKYDNVLGGSDWTRESSSLLPNFFGVLQPLGKGVVGFSYAVTDSVLENQDQFITNIPGTQVDGYILNVNNEDTTYKIGPSYALELTPEFSIGATLYFHMRSSETIVNQTSTISANSTFEWQNAYLQTDEYGFEPVIGLMWTPADKFSLGVALRQTTVQSSTIEQQITCSTNDTTVSDCSSLSPATLMVSSSAKRTYPLTINAGLAYFPTNRLIISADYTYYGQADGDDGQSTESPLRTKVATWNAAVGAEYFVDNRWVVRGGLYTNNANTPQLTQGAIGQPEHVDMTGLAFSVTRQSRNTSITVGLGTAWGKGDAQVIQSNTNIQTLNASTTTLFLSSSYNY